LWRGTTTSTPQCTSFQSGEPVTLRPVQPRSSSQPKDSNFCSKIVNSKISSKLVVKVKKRKSRSRSHQMLWKRNRVENELWQKQLPEKCNCTCRKWLRKTPTLWMELVAIPRVVTLILSRNKWQLCLEILSCLPSKLKLRRKLATKP